MRSNDDWLHMAVFIAVTVSVLWNIAGCALRDPMQQYHCEDCD